MKPAFVKLGTTVLTLPENPVDIYKSIRMDYPKFFKMDNLSKAGIIAAELMLSACPLSAKYNSEEIGIVLSDKYGSLDTDIEFHKTISVEEDFFPSPALFVYTLANIVMGELCIRHKIKGDNIFFIAETFNASLLSDYVTDLFNEGNIKACITGWVDFIDGKPDVLLVLVEKKELTEFTGLEFNKNNIDLLYI